MNRLYNTGRALSLLGTIASINERLDVLINDCCLKDGYRDLPCMEETVYGLRGAAILYPDIDIALSYREAYHILREVLQKASEAGDSGMYREAANLIASLSILSTEIEDKDKNRPGQA